MATILSSTRSTHGSPYAHYTVTAEQVVRKYDSVTIKITVVWRLESSGSQTASMGTGYTLSAYIYLPSIVSSTATTGKWHEIVLKSSSTSINDATTRKVSAEFTIPTQTTWSVIDGMKFKVESSSSSYTGGTLTEVNCEQFAIDSRNVNASTLTLNSNSVNLNNSLSATINSKSSSYTHEILISGLPIETWGYNVSSGSSNYRVICNFKETVLGSLFSSNGTSLSKTLSLRTYDSVGDLMGIDTQDITIIMTSAIGVPDIYANLTSITNTNATFNISIHTKYGATLDMDTLTISTNKGTVSRNGNIITITYPSGTSLDGLTLTISGTDSRNFSSTTQWNYKVDLTNCCVYKDNLWKKCVPYIYKSGKWVKAVKHHYNNSAWDR